MKAYAKCIVLGFIILLMSTAVSTAHGSVKPKDISDFEFYGYVYDDNFNPIQGATVRGGYYETTTDANGYYYLVVRGGPCDQLIAQKNGFFTEVKQVYPYYYPQQVNFRLTKNVYTIVTVVAFFPNTEYAYMKYTYGYHHTVTVKAYLGGFGTTITSREDVTYSVDSPYPHRSTKRKAIASGAYDEFGNLLDLFIVDFEDNYDQFYENEYLNPNNIGGEIWGILPGSTVEKTASLSGSVTLQGGLKTTVCASILGKSVSQELETTLAVTVGYTNQFYWKITNTDTYKHYFKIYYEGNTLVHIWDLGRESSGGGGGGCPILFVWNGTHYVEEGSLDIHNPNGTDVTTFHMLHIKPKPVHGVLQLRLTEHPQTHSYIDQVKLYAELENGQLIELKLISATHSEYGNVLPQLLFSDEWKTDTLGANLNNGTSQSINLKFKLRPDIKNKITGFVFQIEGNNIVLKV
ncbi:MAG: hypothetical protein QHH12_06785 [Candidatus Bathyarchaeota archaeon]|jgi:hypothetical protein|nr:carboxypeptidase regulatory-like domain-containing protein [Candidatus Bathyarchaeota archaeon A05DMB-3]MDH7607447.1 hypothetical protein [Candidatus Bathyarchaeota archaeon]